MRVSIITNIITSYREGFYDRLLDRKEVEIMIYCNDRMKGTSLKSIHHKYGNNVQIVPSLQYKNDLIGFQFLPFWKIIKNSDVIFLDGNPRTISNLLMGFIALFLTKKRIVIWSMAHSFGANPFTENIRLKWTSLYKNIFVYTDQEVETLREKGFISQNIIGMNNGLDQTKIDNEAEKWTEKTLNDWNVKMGFQDQVLLLSIARLMPKNKFEQMVQALPAIIKIFPNVKWCLIGAGAEEVNLKNMARELQVDDHIYFAGAIYEEDELAPFFLSAELFIHPASIGLSVMHAFGYGLPVVVNSQEEMHGPEYGAFKHNVTGKNFIPNDVRDLENAVISLLENPKILENMKENTLKLAREKFNVDVMTDRFIKMALGN